MRLTKKMLLIFRTYSMLFWLNVQFKTCLIPKIHICDTAWVSMTTALKTILIIQEVHAILPAFHKECWEALSAFIEQYRYLKGLHRWL